MPSGLIDTHCHIQSVGAGIGERSTRELWAKAGTLNADAVLKNAGDAGVQTMVCVGCDLEDSRLAIHFAQAHSERCRASIGLHPHEAQHYYNNDAQRAAFTELITDSTVVAVGECGLDYFYEHSPREAQLDVLRFQFELAIQHDKPMIFHVREAFSDFWPLFDEYNAAQPIRGVLHSYTDNANNLAMALKRGLYIGVNGIATFAKSEPQLAVYKSIPLQNLVLETDAPFLTPAPYRGTVNEPKHLPVVATFLSKLRAESYDDIARATTENGATLFGL